MLVKGLCVSRVVMLSRESGRYWFEGMADQGNLAEVTGIDGGGESPFAHLCHHEALVFEFAQSLADRRAAHLHVLGQLRFVDCLIGADIEGDNSVGNDPVGKAGQRFDDASTPFRIGLRINVRGHLGQR